MAGVRGVAGDARATGVTRKQKRKAANGRGDKIVEKTPGSGRYHWRVTVALSSKGLQVRKSGVVDSHAAASAARDEALVAARRGTLVRSTTITIWEYSQGWLQGRTGQIAASTWDQYRMALEHIPAQIRRVKVQSLTDRHLAQVDQAMVVRGDSEGKALPPAAVATRRKVFTVLRMVLVAAEREQPIPAGTIPHRVVRMTLRNRDRPGERPALNPVEIGKLLNVCRDHDQRIIPWLLFSLGLRRGEMLGLRWSDIDWKARTIRLEQQVRVAGSIVEISDELKTASAYRTLGMAPDLIEVLREHRAKQDAWRTGPGWNPENLIVVTEAGTGYRPRSVNQLLERLSARGWYPAHRQPRRTPNQHHGSASGRGERGGGRSQGRTLQFRGDQADLPASDGRRDAHRGVRSFELPSFRTRRRRVGDRILSRKLASRTEFAVRPGAPVRVSGI